MHVHFAKQSHDRPFRARPCVIKRFICAHTLFKFSEERHTFEANASQTARSCYTRVIRDLICRVDFSLCREFKKQRFLKLLYRYRIVRYKLPGLTCARTINPQSEIYFSLHRRSIRLWERAIETISTNTLASSTSCSSSFLLAFTPRKSRPTLFP